MNYRVFSDNEWLYPDSEMTQGSPRATLYAARGGDVCFQILTDGMLKGDEKITASLPLPGCEVILYRLLPACVKENSGPEVFTTKNYDEVKHFVTRKAPFEVYELTLPLDADLCEAGRAAFFVRINVAADAPVGERTATLTVSIGEESLEVPVDLKIYNATVPALKDADFHMVNWIYYKNVALDFGVKTYSEEYMKILRAFLENQLDMRNDYLMIPAGVPVKDAEGRVVDFDFSEAEIVGNLALSMGFTYIMGGFVVHFNHWRESEIYLLWDKTIGVRTIEAFRQLKLYFTRAWECVKRNGWEKHYQQCLEDEPQFTNDDAYRIVGAICRKCMPGIVIHDPVEATTLGGGCDVWDVKQAVFEKYIEDFRALQEMGEEMWLYTCGFPAGAMMNRIVDLPIAASRLPMWMCCLYGARGFLHWGYHRHNPEGREDVGFHATESKDYPPGNSFVVYNGDGRPWYSVRGHAQRTGAEDAELLLQLQKKNKELANTIIRKVCRSFEDYESSAALLDEARHELLEALG